MKQLPAHYPHTATINGAGHLEIGGVDTQDLVERFGTPLTVMDEETIVKSCQDYREALASKYPESQLLFAGKALANRGVFSLISKRGLGFDLVSSGEIRTAQKAGVDLSRSVFHGNNKLPPELQAAVDARIGWIVVDHLDELPQINALGRKQNRKIPILLRMNPGIEAHTHEFIQTGQIDSKFGLPPGDFEKAGPLLKTLPDILFEGIHLHIGSQILELKPFDQLARKAVEFAEFFFRRYGFRTRVLNLGGGLGIPYLPGDKVPSISGYISSIANSLRGRLRGTHMKKPLLMLEPGRSIVGRAGLTLYRVGVIKTIPGVRTYVSVDGGMADNPRPILYQATYDAAVANRMRERPKERVAIAGRYCESGDVLIRDIRLGRVRSGDILAVFGTGAYTYSMASNYNRVPRPAMVLVAKGKARLLVRRETDADLLQYDV